MRERERERERERGVDDNERGCGSQHSETEEHTFLFFLLAFRSSF